MHPVQTQWGSITRYKGKLNKYMSMKGTVFQPRVLQYCRGICRAGVD